MHLLPSALIVLCFTTQHFTSAQRSTTTRSSTTTSDTSRTRTTDSNNPFYSSSFSTLNSYSAPAFTGTRYTYDSPSGQRTVTAASSGIASGNGSASGSANSTSTTKRHSLTQISGGTHTLNGTASSTSSAATPSNTVPCNGYPEFCARKYSNITQVCAHNSAFVVPNNAGSNQALPVNTQLNDGIRMIQGETHYVNGTIMNCHTTCELLNAGPWLAELQVVAQWLRDNPYDVVTWLIVNSNFVSVDKYVPAIEAAGIRDLLYEPQYVPQRRSQWPTLGEMILSGKRLVMFMDYNANQTAVPYILDEFTHMWETPFSPTDPNFPCTQQRPPNLNQTVARDDYMSLANHNLNTAVDISAILGTGSTDQEPILIPNTAQINRTNGLADAFGQAGAMSERCTRDWGRPPNFLLVDYYNYGLQYKGSIFAVAAKANGVSYRRSSCCGSMSSAAAKTAVVVGAGEVSGSLIALVAAVGFTVVLAW